MTPRKMQQTLTRNSEKMCDRMPLATTSFQNHICDNLCFGCGPSNPMGLKIKSYWSGKDESVCCYMPEKHHNAGPDICVNGGIIATIIDCHTICTAIADAYRREGRVIGSEPGIWYATGKLTVNYLRPAPIDTPVLLSARIVEAKGKKTLLTCTLYSDDIECATAEVVAVKVPPGWREGQSKKA